MQQRWQKSSWQYLYMQNYREILWDVLVISCAKKTCALLCRATAHKCQELESNWGVLAFHPMTWRWAGLSTVNLVRWKNTVRLLLVGWKLRLPCPRGAGWAGWAAAKSRCFSIFRSTTSLLGRTGPASWWPWLPCAQCQIYVTLQGWGFFWCDRSDLASRKWSLQKNPFLMNSCSEPVRTRLEKNVTHIIRNFWFRLMELWASWQGPSQDLPLCAQFARAFGCFTWTWLCWPCKIPKPNYPQIWYYADQVRFYP